MVWLRVNGTELVVLCAGDYTERMLVHGNDKLVSDLQF